MYNILGWMVMHQGGGSDSSAVRMRQEHLDHCRELVDAFRTRNPVAVRSVAGRHYDDGDRIGAESLIPAHTSGQRQRRIRGGRHLRIV